MTTAAHLKHVTSWLADLANLTSGTSALVDAKPKIAAMASVIADAFAEPATFCKASLVAVSRECPYFPSFAELDKHLGAWWEKNRPAPVFLPSELQNVPGLTGEDRMAIEVWLRHDLDNDLSAHVMSLRLGVIRQSSDASFLWLTGNNARARDIAERNGWVKQASDPFIDPARIIASVRAIVDPPHPMANVLLSCLRAGVERDAPQHVELVPRTLADTVGGAVGTDRKPTPQQAADIRADDGLVKMPPPQESTPATVDFTAKFVAKHGRKPGEPTPEEVQIRRLGNTLLKPIAEREQAQAERPEPEPPPQPNPIEQPFAQPRAAAAEHRPARKVLKPLDWGDPPC